MYLDRGYYGACSFYSGLQNLTVFVYGSRALWLFFVVAVAAAAAACLFVCLFFVLFFLPVWKASAEDEQRLTELVEKEIVGRNLLGAFGPLLVITAYHIATYRA